MLEGGCFISLMTWSLLAVSLAAEMVIFGSFSEPPYT